MSEETETPSGEPNPLPGLSKVQSAKALNPWRSSQKSVTPRRRLAELPEEISERRGRRIDDVDQIPIQEFFIPIWGQVRLTKRELKLVDHPAFSRLGSINQLGQTFYVFRGATHKRWEHALGTLHASELMVNAIERNWKEAQTKGGTKDVRDHELGLPLSTTERSFVRLAALLHDIGHIAAGHTFEDELALLSKHDGNKRLTQVLDKSVWRGKTYEKTLRQLIDELYEDDAKSVDDAIAASSVFLHIVSKDPVEPAISQSDFRLKVCRDLVGNTFCADLLDYLHRDLWHVGKARTFDSRVLDYLEIRRDDVTEEEGSAVTHRSSIVVNLRGNADIRSDGISAIFDLLEARFQLGETVLYHRTKLTASAMLERLVAEIADIHPLDEEWFDRQIDRLLELSDEELLGVLFDLGVERLEGSTETRERQLEVRQCLDLARRLRDRELHKKVHAFKAYELSGSMEFVRTTYGGSEGRGGRLTACRNLEADFKLPPGSVVFYCPRKAPHAKIAKVRVLVNGRIDDAARLDGEQSDPIRTAGLFGDQLKRFEGLWRVQVSASSEAIQQLSDTDTRFDFERAVLCLVLNTHHDSMSSFDTAEDIARSLVRNQKFNVGGALQLAAPQDVHARASSDPTLSYETGAPRLTCFMSEQ